MASLELVPYQPPAEREPAGEPTTEIIPIDPMRTTEVHTIPPNAAGTGTEIMPAVRLRTEFDPLRLISEQVHEDGEQRGRPDLTGFWLRDREGRVYEFTDHDAHLVTNKETKPTGMRRPRARSTLRGGPYFGRSEKEKTILTQGREERWTVKVTGPDGALEDIIGYAGDDELNGWLDNPSDHATPFEWFTGFGWHEAVERPGQGNPETREIRQSNPDKSVFDTVMEHQENLGLGLNGVAWRINGDVQRITEDTFVMEGPVGNRHPVRTFVVKTYNTAGDAKHQRVYKDDGLKKHLNNMGGALSDLHMEMPEEPLDPVVVSSIGRVSTSFIMAPGLDRSGWTEGPDTFGREYDSSDSWIPTAQAIRLLSYEDIFTFNDIYRDNLSVADRVRNHGEQFLGKYVGALQETVTELGKNAVIDIASRMGYEYTEALRDFGLDQDAEDSSLGMMLWELMGQRYMSKNPRELTDEFQLHDDFGIKIGDPFDGDPIEARRVQRMIIDNLIGQKVAGATLEVIKPGEKVLGHDKEGRDIVKEVPDTYGLNWDALNALNLPAFVKQEVVDILQTVTAGTPGHKLSKKEFVAVGRRLQRARLIG